MHHAIHTRDAGRAVLLVAGALVGLAVAFGTMSISWETGAVGLGFALAALAGIAQTCSA
jgi:hypothetical protein